MQALIVIDAQNEFAEKGQRPVPGFLQAVEAIKNHVGQARLSQQPIAWIRHFNQPHESPAFVPGSWGAAFYEGFTVLPHNDLEKEFHKNVYGAFTGTDIGSWLKDQGVDQVLIVGFYTHGCVSTTAREAIMRNLKVSLDLNATGTCDMKDALLGDLSADEVRRSALLQLVHMGATMI